MFSMQKISIFMFLLLGLLFLSSFGVALGEMMSSVGVARGDVFRYRYACYFGSNDPNAIPSASFLSINQTDYFMINVTGVSGASVNFDATLRGLNGSESFGVCVMNVGTGVTSISGYGGPSQFYFMTRNVGMMGRMFPSANESPTINDTFMMNYAGGQRLTSHLVTTTNQNGATIQSDSYFDQATGMMVEWHQQNIQTNGASQTNSTQMMQIISSSLWTVPEFPVSIAVSTLIVSTVVTILAIVVIHKRKRCLAY
jgi:hypothetical protein